MDEQEWRAALDKYLTRVEWESWLRDVYTYRHQELETEIAGIMAVLNRLSSVVDRAEATAQLGTRIIENTWLHVGIVAALLTPLATVLVLVVRR